MSWERRNGSNKEQGEEKKDRNGNKKVFNTKERKREKIREEIIREEAGFKEIGQKKGRGYGISLMLDWMGYWTVKF